MLDPGQARDVAEEFGVADAQVRRDHLISHLLAAIGTSLADEIVFFGGTALARGFFPHARLSEDLDLIAVKARPDVAEQLTSVLVRAVRREYPGLRWDPPLTEVRDTEPARLVGPDVAIRVQLLDGTGLPAWPTVLTDLEQRYDDAPPARLRILTQPAFVVAKTVAWADRGAMRDLFDLAVLAANGAVDQEAGRLYRRLGPTGALPVQKLFKVPADEDRWRGELAGQTRLRLTAAEALAVVDYAWARVRKSFEASARL